jgi:ribosome-associated heat shock protein Hsp15
MRIDRWLWAARFFKTRGLATDAVAGGHVRVNSERVKPAKDVRTGDIVDVRVGETRFTVVVQGLAEKRGPARVAATLYEETAESVAARAAAAAERRLSRAPGAGPGGPRATKLDRRRIEALRRDRRA